MKEFKPKEKKVHYTFCIEEKLLADIKKASKKYKIPVSEFIRVSIWRSLESIN